MIIYDEILFPSFMSLSFSCLPNGLQIIEDNGYSVAGKVTNNLITGEVKKEIYHYSIKTLKHEHCHEVQIDRGYPSQSCLVVYGKLLAEGECYIAEELDNVSYGLLYGPFQ